MAPHLLLPLLLEYLLVSCRFTGRVGRTVTTSHALDIIARRHGLEVVETPSGFQYLGEVITRGEVPLTPIQQGRLTTALASPPERLAGVSVRHVSTLDGLKLYLSDGNWFMVKLSTVEAVVRFYAESENRDTTETLLDEGQDVFLGSAGRR